MNLPHPRLAARLAGLITVATAATLVPAVAEASAWPGHPDRTIVKHRVLPGETATGLAVRYHAWTAELLRLNRLGSTGVIYQGQVLRIPIGHGEGNYFAPPELVERLERNRQVIFRYSTADGRITASTRIIRFGMLADQARRNR